MKTGRRSLFGALIGAPLLSASAAQSASSVGTREGAGERIDELRYLRDRQAIHDLMCDYARGLDRVDEPLLRSCFWPDATVRYGRYDGSADGYVDFCLEIVRALLWGAHHLSNTKADIRGDLGVVETLYFAHHHRVSASGGGEEDLFVEGRYLDWVERRDGRWRIARRRGVFDYNVVVPGQPYANIPAGQHSASAPDDPLYEMLAELRGGV